jgi:hypothetical protein
VHRRAFLTAAILRRSHLLDTVKGEVVAPRVVALADGCWHFEHGDTKAEIRFEGERLSEAIVDKGGHPVRFVRVSS